MNILAPKLSVIDLRVQARLKIIIAGTIALKPSGMQSIRPLKDITLRIRKKITVKITGEYGLEINEPKELALDNASLPWKELTVNLTVQPPNTE